MIKVNIKPSSAKLVTQTVIELLASAVDLVEDVSTSVHKRIEHSQDKTDDHQDNSQ